MRSAQASSEMRAPAVFFSLDTWFLSQHLMNDHNSSNEQRQTSYQERIAFWDSVAEQREVHGTASRAYHRRLCELFQYHIAPGHRVSRSAVERVICWRPWPPLMGWVSISQRE